MTAEDPPVGDLDPELAARLADPAVWAEPPAALQEQIVDAIAAEHTPVRRSLGATLLAGAAVAVLVVGIVVGVNAIQEDNTVTYAVALRGTELAPSASGSATLTKTTSGWKIALHGDGLPRRANRTYYEAWLRSDDGVLVPVGTFNSFQDVTLWSGVSPEKNPTLTITRETADGDAGSSGEVVLAGVAKER